MTLLYRPVLIESAEQAEALPEGTIIIHAENYPQEKFAGLWGREGNSSASLAEEEGWSALVPIEAEEGIVVDTADLNLDPEHEYWSDDPNLLDAVRDAPKRTRLVTTWTPTEEA